MCSTPSKAIHQRPNYPEIRSSTTRAACPNENGDGWSATLCEKWVASKSLLAETSRSDDKAAVRQMAKFGQCLALAMSIFRSILTVQSESMLGSRRAWPLVGNAYKIEVMKVE
jgi:hypothetical protein